MSGEGLGPAERTFEGGDPADGSLPYQKRQVNFA